MTEDIKVLCLKNVKYLKELGFFEKSFNGTIKIEINVHQGGMNDANVSKSFYVKS